MKKLNRSMVAWVAVVVAVLGFMLFASQGLAWQTDPQNVNHTGNHVFDRGYVDLTGTTKINGTALTATATELNGLDASAATDLYVGDDLIFSDGSYIDPDYTSGTLGASLRIVPLPTANKTAQTRDALVCIGELTGSASYGFGSSSNESRALMISVGRTAPAAAAYSAGGFDEALDVRMMNRMTNNAACSIRGAYIKAKNYTSGTVGGLEGAFIEAVADGTDTGGEAVVLKLGTDASTVDYGIDMNLVSTPATADIRFSNGALMKNGDANTLTITEATVAITGAATVSSTLAVTGQATFTETPKFTTTTNEGAVVADALVNLPTGATTNAVFFKVQIGTTTYAVPAYALP